MHKLRKVRESLGLTVDDLSRKSGISHSCITRIESMPTNVNIETAARLSRALSIELDNLFSYDQLSERGRPPMTGIPYSRTRPPKEVLCLQCTMMVLPADICNSCEAVLVKK